jgi:hypothetical protein
MVFSNSSSCNQLIQEREVIHANMDHISTLSDEFTNLTDLHNDSSELTFYQVNILNEKRINLRHNIVDLKEGLQIHFDLGEEVLKPLVGVLLLQALVLQHVEMLRKLSDIDSLILNLSPRGMLFNSAYLKDRISAIFLVLRKMNGQESSLLAFFGICRNEEPL